jgi:hypothetical protein
VLPSNDERKILIGLQKLKLQGFYANGFIQAASLVSGCRWRPGNRDSHASRWYSTLLNLPPRKAESPNVYEFEHIKIKLIFQCGNVGFILHWENVCPFIFPVERKAQRWPIPARLTRGAERFLFLIRVANHGSSCFHAKWREVYRNFFDGRPQTLSEWHGSTMSMCNFSL